MKGSCRGLPPVLRKIRQRAFTLLEMLVAFAVFAVIMSLLLSITSNVGQVAGSSNTSFQEARTAFETMNRLLSQALLNTYLDYDNPTDPAEYVRASELHFVMGDARTITGFNSSPRTAEGTAVFFQAPLGFSDSPDLKQRTGLLNTIGFYVCYSESDDLPSYIGDPTRQRDTAAYRLWMYLDAAENLRVFDQYNGDPQGASDLAWLRGSPDLLAAPQNNHVLANNAILLLIRSVYEDATGGIIERYEYDSRPAATGGQQPVTMNQLPRALRVTLVVIDDRSAANLLAVSDGRYDLLQVPGPGLFVNPERYADDMSRLTDHLNGRPIGQVPIKYRVFEATVEVASAKWSI